jgi:hypothetical protein
VQLYIQLANLASKIFDDEDISCPFPRLPLNEKSDFSDDTLHTFLYMTRLARISAKIQKRLYSSTALLQPIENLRATRDALEEELSVWLNDLPDISNPTKPLRPLGTGPLVHLNQILFIRFSYFNAALALHRRFASPYLFTDDGSEIASDLAHTEPWRVLSVRRAVESARQTIILCRHIEVESYTPSW